MSDTSVNRKTRRPLDVEKLEAERGRLGSLSSSVSSYRFGFENIKFRGRTLLYNFQKLTTSLAYSARTADIDVTI